MTLRARLTCAFLAVVLGPVLLAAVFVGAAVSRINQSQSVERLDLAASSVRASVAGMCRQLRTAADSVAVLLAGGQPPAAAAQIVEQGLASGVRVTDAAGDSLFTTANAPPGPWADCAGSAGDGETRAYTAIAAGVELRDRAGNLLGRAFAVQAFDRYVLRGLADAAGAGVTLLGPVDGAAEGAPAPTGAALSTESRGDAAAVAAAAATVSPGVVGKTRQGRYVRREGPVPDQPLPLALSVPGRDPAALYALLLGVVLAAALATVAAAWLLARSTTRPLAELASAADRVAGGDLAARVPVRNLDEVGRLGSALNQMTREMQTYLQALAASRDQLRGHLGVLGDTLSGTHDLDRILQVLLRTSLAATGAQAGVVLLANPAAGVLIGQYGQGLADRVAVPADGAPALRVPIGAGLLGGVAASGQARRGRVDRDGPRLHPAEPRCLTYVAVPFRAGGTPPGPPSGHPPPVAGVLALYDRLGQDEFDGDDLVRLREYAARAAVAVENVRAHEEARRLSVTDPLTGLLNYRSLVESLRREVERANRFRRTLGVLALDLDRFKTVNDSYGHAAGDAVLVECARRIRDQIREVDLAFRRGGEEFVVLLPETDAAGAAVVTQRLARALHGGPVVVTPGGREPTTDGSATDGSATVAVSVTVSVGIAVYPDHGDTGRRVLEAADDALYAAKAAGRDTYRIAGGAGTGGVASPTQPPRQTRGG